MTSRARDIILFAALFFFAILAMYGLMEGLRLAHADDVIHLVCEGCSTVQHHHADQIGHLRSHLGTDHGFEATWFDVVVHGRCDACT